MCYDKLSSNGPSVQLGFSNIENMHTTALQCVCRWLKRHTRKTSFFGKQRKKDIFAFGWFGYALSYKGQKQKRNQLNNFFTKKGRRQRRCSRISIFWSEGLLWLSFLYLHTDKTPTDGPGSSFRGRSLVFISKYF